MPGWNAPAMTPGRIRAFVVIAAVGAVLLAFYLALALRTGSTAPDGTRVGGVAIAGMNPDEAAAAVTRALDKRSAKKLRVVALDRTFVVKPKEAGLSLDTGASVAPVYGHTWNPLDIAQGLIGGGRTYPAVVAVDYEALSAQVQLIADSIDVAATEPVLRVIDGEPVLQPGVAGRALDQAATSAALVEAVMLRRKPIDARVLKVDPTVAAAAASTALQSARSAVSAPVTVHAESITAQIPASAIGKALSYSAVDGNLVPSLDGAVLHRSIRSELRPIEVRGRNATFKIRHGIPRVAKSKVGRGVADEELANAVAAVLTSPAESRTVTVSVGVREPQLTTAQARQLGVKERMSTFTQNFPYAAYRVQNIGEAARRINGTLLMPGDTFSMNDTIKERTEANGYTVGFVIGEGGVFDEQLGGGVSTATTATWTAAFFAGLERVQTVAHSIYISRYQPGLEATVAWGIFDMKFRNDTPNAVFITSSITNSSITVSMWGTKVYDEIRAVSGKQTNIRPFDTIYDKSPNCLGQGGVNGFDITVDRVFYKDGKEVKREPITTKYKPAPEVICGKKPPKKPGKHPDGSEPSPSPSSPASPAPSATDNTFTNAASSPSASKPARAARRN